jgi:glycosyltransferase involved in cell wall biosynthesis
MMPPLFSVIIPTYNRAHCICDTLNSVAKQTYSRIEIIVIDDGSTDNTEEVIEQWRGSTHHSLENAHSTQIKTESRTLRYIKQSNGGASVARNRGLQEITGEYIQFLDSDDRLHPERFEQLAKAFAEYEADFIQTTIEWFDPENNKVSKILRARPNADQVHLVMQGVFWANTLRGALTKTLAQRIGPWEEGMACFEDREYMERAVLLANKPIALEPTLGYLARGAGDHVSNIHTTFEGRKWRIFCEAKLVEQVKLKPDISLAWKSELASRIYRVACRSTASGWYTYGQDCVQIADSLNAPRSIRAQVKRCLAKLGPAGGVLYRGINRLKGVSHAVCNF